MPLPETIRVKLSSEDAGAISLTRAVAREMPLRELVEYMLPLTGKEVGRIREILLRGTLVSGASRFRWQGWRCEESALCELLATFPDPDPTRVFERGRCVRVVLRGSRGAIEVTREAGAATPRFHRAASFWEVLMQVAEAALPRYAGYSYGGRADRYEASLTPASATLLRAAASAVVHSSLRNRLEAAELFAAELYVER